VYHFSLRHSDAFSSDIAIWTAVKAASHRLSLLGFRIYLICS